MQNAETGQILTMGLPGPELDDELRAFIRAAQPGGFILFGRNIEAPAQLRGLIDELRSLCAAPPIVTVDQEGGRVSRLAKIGEAPPFADELRRAARPEWIQTHGALTARLLRLFGFNLDLAPVVDILLDPSADNSLPGRCYGVNAAEVTANAGLFLDALQKGGVAGTIKHFPGYSLCRADPHREFPVVRRSTAELAAAELQPFRALGPRAAALMVGHAHYPDLDPQLRPSSLSPPVITGLLRQQLGYQGLVVSDDLEMGAITREYGPAQVVRMAVDAGNDLLLFCHQRECVEIALRTLAALPADRLAQPLARVREFKRHLPPPVPWSQQEFVAINAEIRALRETVASTLTEGP